MARRKIVSQFGEKLARILKEKGVTQTRLSELTGISQPLICNYISGKIQPSFHFADKIARAIGCSLDDLRDD